MTSPDKLSVKAIEDIANPIPEQGYEAQGSYKNDYIKLAQQYLDTMREVDELRHALEIISKTKSFEVATAEQALNRYKQSENIARKVLNNIIADEFCKNSFFRTGNPPQKSEEK